MADEEEEFDPEEDSFDLTPKGEMYIREILFRYRRGDNLEDVAEALELSQEEISILFAMGEYFGVADYEAFEVPDYPPKM